MRSSKIWIQNEQRICERRLVDVDAEPARAFVQRKTEHARDDKIEVERRSAVDKVRRQVSHKGQVKRRCDDGDNHARRETNALNEYNHYESFNVRRSHSPDRVESY